MFVRHIRILSNKMDCSTSKGCMNGDQEMWSKIGKNIYFKIKYENIRSVLASPHAPLLTYMRTYTLTNLHVVGA